MGAVRGTRLELWWGLRYDSTSSKASGHSLKLLYRCEEAVGVDVDCVGVGSASDRAHEVVRQTGLNLKIKLACVCKF